jgi:hypothetical protein
VRWPAARRRLRTARAHACFFFLPPAHLLLLPPVVPLPCRRGLTAQPPWPCSLASIAVTPLPQAGPVTSTAARPLNRLAAVSIAWPAFLPQTLSSSKPTGVRKEGGGERWRRGCGRGRPGGGRHEFERERGGRWARRGENRVAVRMKKKQQAVIKSLSYIFMKYIFIIYIYLELHILVLILFFIQTC